MSRPPLRAGREQVLPPVPTDLHKRAARSTFLTQGYCYGTGSNVLPMLHVSDLALFVQHVIQQQPSERYLIAVDEGECT